MGQLKRQLLFWGAIATTTAVLPGFALAENVSPNHGGGKHGRGDHGRGQRDGDAKLSVAGRAFSKGTTDSYGLQIRGRSGDQPTDAGGMIRFGHKGDKVMEGLVGEITCLSKDPAGVVSVTGTITRSGKRDGKGDKDKGDKKAPEMSGSPGAPEAPKVPAPTAANDDGTAFLDELAPWDADESADMAEPVRHGRDGKGERGGKGKGERGRKGGGELAGKDFAFTIASAGEPQKFSTPTIGDKGTLAACSGGGDTVDVTRGGFKVREAGADEAKGDEKGKDNGKDRGDRKGRRGWWRR